LPFEVSVSATNVSGDCDWAGTASMHKNTKVAAPNRMT
jgi:hypothetical protein